MPKERDVFKVERQGDTLILTPIRNLRELDFEAIEAGADAVMLLLDQEQVKNVVMDFHNTDYYGSTALAFFVKLWKRVRSGGGQMAFCEVSQHEREVLHLTNLDTLWPLYGSRAEALGALE